MKTDCKYVLVWFLQIYKILKKINFQCEVGKERNRLRSPWTNNAGLHVHPAHCTATFSLQSAILFFKLGK